MKKIIKDTLILTAITLISGLALATVYQITKQPIAQAEAAAELAAYEGVFPEATFETLAPASFDPVAAGVADGEGVTVEAVAAARRDGRRRHRRVDRRMARHEARGILPACA